MQETTGPIPPEVLEMVNRRNQERNERAGYPPPPTGQGAPGRTGDKTETRSDPKPRPRQKKTDALRWFVATGEAGAIRVLGPFDTVEDAQEVQEAQKALGGRSKLYQATKKHQAESAYLKFLTAVSTGRDSW